MRARARILSLSRIICCQTLQCQQGSVQDIAAAYAKHTATMTCKQLAVDSQSWCCCLQACEQRPAAWFALLHKHC